jgi:hypothetical protein
MPCCYNTHTTLVDTPMLVALGEIYTKCNVVRGFYEGCNHQNIFNEHMGQS